MMVKKLTCKLWQTIFWEFQRNFRQCLGWRYFQFMTSDLLWRNVCLLRWQNSSENSNETIERSFQFISLLVTFSKISWKFSNDGLLSNRLLFLVPLLSTQFCVFVPVYLIQSFMRKLKHTRANIPIQSSRTLILNNVVACRGKPGK